MQQQLYGAATLAEAAAPLPDGDLSEVPAHWQQLTQPSPPPTHWLAMLERLGIGWQDVEAVDAVSSAAPEGVDETVWLLGEVPMETLSPDEVLLQFYEGMVAIMASADLLPAVQPSPQDAPPAIKEDASTRLSPEAPPSTMADNESEGEKRPAGIPIPSALPLAPTAVPENGPSSSQGLHSSSSASYPIQRRARQAAAVPSADRQQAKAGQPAQDGGPSAAAQLDGQAEPGHLEGPPRVWALIAQSAASDRVEVQQVTAERSAAEVVPDEVVPTTPERLSRRPTVDLPQPSLHHPDQTVETDGPTERSIRQDKDKSSTHPKTFSAPSLPVPPLVNSTPVETELAPPSSSSQPSARPRHPLEQRAESHPGLGRSFGQHPGEAKTQLVNRRDNDTAGKRGQGVNRTPLSSAPQREGSPLIKDGHQSSSPGFDNSLPKRTQSVKKEVSSAPLPSTKVPLNMDPRSSTPLPSPASGARLAPTGPMREELTQAVLGETRRDVLTEETAVPPAIGTPIFQAPLPRLVKGEDPTHTKVDTPAQPSSAVRQFQNLEEGDKQRQTAPPPAHKLPSGHQKGEHKKRKTAVVPPQKSHFHIPLPTLPSPSPLPAAQEPSQHDAAYSGSNPAQFPKRAVPIRSKKQSTDGQERGVQQQDRQGIETVGQRREDGETSIPLSAPSEPSQRGHHAVTYPKRSLGRRGQPQGSNNPRPERKRQHPFYKGSFPETKRQAQQQGHGAAQSDSDTSFSWPPLPRPHEAINFGVEQRQSVQRRARLDREQRGR